MWFLWVDSDSNIDNETVLFKKSDGPGISFNFIPPPNALHLVLLTLISLALTYLLTLIRLIVVTFIPKAKPTKRY